MSGNVRFCRANNGLPGSVHSRAIGTAYPQLANSARRRGPESSILAGMDINAEVVRLGGVATAAQLGACGFGPAALGHALRAGSIHRIRRGNYAVAGAHEDLVAAALVGARLTCVSAAPFFGIDVLHRSDTPHFAVGSGHPTLRAGNRHRAPIRPSGATPFLVSPEDAVVHALHCLPELDALVLAESAVARRLVAAPAVLARLPGRANGPARRILGLVDPHSGSVLETVARRGFLEAGLTVETQVDIHRVGWVDFLINGCLIVEVDGYDFHSDPKTFASDRHRSNNAFEQGCSLNQPTISRFSVPQCPICPAMSDSEGLRLGQFTRTVGGGPGGACHQAGKAAVGELPQGRFGGSARTRHIGAQRCRFVP